MTERGTVDRLGVVFRDGEEVFLEGEPGDYMYVIQSGSVEIYSNIGGQQTTLCTLGPGEIFGEMALLDNEPRMASARARGEMRAIRFDRGTLLERVREDPNIVLRLLRAMSERVRSLSLRLEHLKSTSGLDSSSLAAAVREHVTT